MSDEDRREQYRQIWENLRNHDRLIWQLPSTSAAIAGGIGIAAFQFVSDKLTRELVILVGVILTGILLRAMIKHRYFSGVEQETLTKMEDDMKLKRIQRKTEIDKCEEELYWYTETPKWWQKGSAHNLLIGGMGGILCLLIALMVWTEISPISDFDITIQPSALATHTTRSSDFLVIVTAKYGPANPVILQISGGTPGIKENLGPIAGQAPFISKLTVTADESVQSGTYELEVIAKSGDVTHSGKVLFVVP